MDEEWKRARLDELWETYLPGTTRLEIEQGEPRSFACIEGILRARADHRLSKGCNNVVGMIMAASKGRMLWQLLSLEVGDWLLDDGFISDAFTQESLTHTRSALTVYLDYATESGSPPHRPAIDPTPVLLPRWILNELQAALAALDEGEVHGIVEPDNSGRHGDAWSWDQMRACALEHVAFLHGQGVAKQMARRRVSALTNISEGSLRDWERSENLSEGLRDAREAGRLKILFEDNPKYAEGDGNTVSGEALARLAIFKTGLSLADFGKAYRERFGHRHNPGSTAGD